MEPKPLLSGTVALVVGSLGTAAAAIAPLLPPPFSVPVGIIGFISAALAGLAVRPPAVVEGKPLVQGTALTLSGLALGGLAQLYPMLPAGWPQSAAFGVVAVLAWLSGKTLPALGTMQGGPVTPAPAPSPAPVADAPAAADTFNRPGPQP